MVAAGENIHQVADGSVDVAVCTLVRKVCGMLRPVNGGRGSGRDPSALCAKRDTCRLQA